MAEEKSSRVYEEWELKRLAEKPVCDELRSKIGLVRPLCPCLVCGHLIDEYTVQCEQCGQIYTGEDLLHALSIDEGRRRGVPEEVLAQVIANIRCWMKEHPDRLTGPLPIDTPLFHAITAVSENETRN